MATNNYTSEGSVKYYKDIKAGLKSNKTNLIKMHYARMRY